MHNFRGALLMIVSMGFFALEDMFIKLAAEILPVGQIILISGLTGFALFGVAVALMGERFAPIELLQPSVLLRNGSELVAAICIVSALSMIPLSTTAAILQALPLVLTLMAAAFLGETVGPRRWAAIAIGFVGVLLIVRPGTEAFDPASLLAVLAVLALAARDIVTRVVPATLSSLQITHWSFGSVALAGVGLLMVGSGPRPMDTDSSLQILGIVATGAVGYYAMVLALRMAPISAIAHFRYTRLVFALVLGIAVFDESPDLFTLSGATLIIASGLYTLARERALFSKARQG